MALRATASSCSWCGTSDLALVFHGQQWYTMRHCGILAFVLRERWLTLKDAADRLGVSRTTLFRMLLRGELGTIRRGRFRLVSERSIRDRLARSEVRFPVYTEGHPFRELIGKFRSVGRGPGSSDKYAVLFSSGGGAGSGHR